MDYNKIIFLDIDGVLALCHDPEFQKKCFLAGKLYPFEPSCVSVLNQIIEKTDAEIVLSSSWRTFLTLDELDYIFKENKVIKSPIDVTPIDPTLNGMLNRGLEIQAFLLIHRVNNFVILDDMKVEGFKNNFVSVDGGTGLAENIVTNIIERLMPTRLSSSI